MENLRIKFRFASQIIQTSKLSSQPIPSLGTASPHQICMLSVNEPLAAVLYRHESTLQNIELFQEQTPDSIWNNKIPFQDFGVGGRTLALVGMVSWVEKMLTAELLVAVFFHSIGWWIRGSHAAHTSCLEVWRDEYMYILVMVLKKRCFFRSCSKTLKATRFTSFFL